MRPLPCLAALACALASGCLPVHYALQASAGQLDLLVRARPLEEARERPSTPPRHRALLAEVGPILRFAEERGLRATSNYRRYTPLRRDAAVWVVSACPELSLTPRTWSFPFVGSFPYLGWFDRASARDYARGLAAEGLDVDVRGARAYSTLGWFDDPILSTMLERGPEGPVRLADTLLHESAHATLHVAGQAPFNEGLASFAGTRLALEWLRARRGPGSRAEASFLASQERGRQAEQALRETAQALDALYKSAAPDEEKRAQKRARLEALRARLGWKRPITNATLQQHLTYQAGAEGFARVLDSCAGDWRCFFRKLGALRPADFARPQQQELDGLLARAASSG